MRIKRVATVYVFNRERQVLMLDHPKLGVWMPPGGHIEDGELTNEAALREVKEETGLSIYLARDKFDYIASQRQEVEQLPSPVIVQTERVSNYLQEDFIYLGFSESVKLKPENGIAMGWFSIEEAMNLETFTHIVGHLKYIKNKYFKGSSIYEVI
jgi:8-oxo-dGTP diphosphatase